MITFAKGNLLRAEVDALVNTVNTEGVMGKGIALQFKQAYPEVFERYAEACRRGDVQIGKMHVVDLGGLVGGPRWVINFPTKAHWRAKSKLLDIKLGLVALADEVRRLGIRSIAVPPLGCGFGGLSWADVEPLIREAFASLPSVDVRVYAPDGAPSPKEMPMRTVKPHMTVGRAALVALVDRYMRGLLDPCVSLLEVHKLMYFLQEAGEPLKLNYQKGTYGPYALNLRQVLIKIDGHFLTGYGEGSDTPTKPLELVEGASDEARNFLDHHPEVVHRMERVSELIEGYEDSYGLELLSSVHWVMQREPSAVNSAESAATAVCSWSPRKAKLLKHKHLVQAWGHLYRHQWVH